MTNATLSTFFPTFGFPVSGTSAPYTADRTMPDRLAEVKNVKDFGALGNGSANDTNAIQAAINWTSGNYRGVIFFPPGTYITSAPIILPSTSADQQASLIGVGPLSYIHNTNTSNNGFMFARDFSQAGSSYSGWSIDRLRITNDCPDASSGCLLMRGCAGLVVRDCLIEGSTGLLIDDNTSYAVIVSGCIFRRGGGTYATAYGIVGGGDKMTVTGCDVTGLGTGILIGARPGTGSGSTAMNIYNTRFEVNNIGVRVGYAPDAMVASVILEGCSFEQNGIGVYADYSVASLFSRLTIQGRTDLEPAGIHGIYGNQQTDNVWKAISTGGDFSSASVAFVSTTRVVMLVVNAQNNGSGGSWSLPSGEPGTNIYALQCSP